MCGTTMWTPVKVTTQNLPQESTDPTDDSSLGMTADFTKTR